MPGLFSFLQPTARQPTARQPDLDAVLQGLYGADLKGGALQDVTPLSAGIALHRDPQAAIEGTWHSPPARLVELQTQVERPGEWLGLHIALPLYDLRGVRWIGVVARTAAGQSLTSRICLRSGTGAGGFQDQFFPTHLLSQPSQTDHHDLIAPDHLPDLPQQASWREVILFLPPAHDIHWVLHDLRVFVL